MRTRTFLLTGALALTLPVAAGAGDPGPGDPVDPPLTPKPIATAVTSPSSGATLALVDANPLRIEGTRFRAYELVRLDVTTATRHLVRRLHAGAKGGFAVTFSAVRFAPCASPPPRIVARGASSGRIALSARPPECASG